MNKMKMRRAEYRGIQLVVRRGIRSTVQACETVRERFDRTGRSQTLEVSPSMERRIMRGVDDLIHLRARLNSVVHAV